MKFEKLGIRNLTLITPDVFTDKRGTFCVNYNRDLFYTNGINVDFIQDNCSVSRHGVARGLHFQQYPYEQDKLVSCVKGKILDVALDIRHKSPSFGQWRAVELSEDNKQMLYIPKGFAHGFSVLSDSATVAYKVSAPYNQESECGILYSSVGIDWQLKYNPLTSQKDKEWLSIQEYRRLICES